MIGRLRALGARRSVEPPLDRLKLGAIDHAFRRLGCRTVADLGGVWAVDGGYAFYAEIEHRADRVVICDEDFTASLVEQARLDPRLELVEGNFGRAETAARIGTVDAILLFDVLLHQVHPDWDEIVAMYAGATQCFVLAGPWWNGPGTVRLLDLGRERYLAAVPSEPIYDGLWERLDENNPRRGRPWRDCLDIWQWGITEHDLSERMSALGFELSHREHAGRWMELEDFEDVALVFTRPEAAKASP